MIYISTRGRIHLLEKTIPKWLKVTPENMPIYLVVEPDEEDAHQDFVRKFEGRVKVWRLSDNNLGIGNSRWEAFIHAFDEPGESFISADDDLYPKMDPSILLSATANGSGHWGVGGFFSIYPFMGGLPANEGVLPTRSGIGFRIFSLNKESAFQIGGPPADFRCAEDHELARRGIAEFGEPWRVHTDFPVVSTAARHSRGGMSDYPELHAELLHDAHKMAHMAWPEYLNDPENCYDSMTGMDKCKYRMQWKKFLVDHEAYHEI